MTTTATTPNGKRIAGTTGVTATGRVRANFYEIAEPGAPVEYLIAVTLLAADGTLATSGGRYVEPTKARYSGPHAREVAYREWKKTCQETAKTRARAAAAATDETMTVTVRDRGREAPWGSHGFTNPSTVKITLNKACPLCGGPRGEPRGHNQCDDGAYYWTQEWANPCGHLDEYPAVIAEAVARAKLLMARPSQGLAVTPEQLRAAAAWAASGPNMAPVQLAEVDGTLFVTQGDERVPFDPDGSPGQDRHLTGTPAGGDTPKEG